MISRKTLLRAPSFPALVLVVILVLINGAIVPNFFRPRFAVSFFGSYTPLIIAAIAQTFVMIGGGIDLSIGGTMSLVLAIVVTLADPTGGFQLPLPLAMIIGIVAATAIGGFNGLVVGYLRVTPLLATLATLTMAQGLALVVMPHPMGTVTVQYPLWYSSALISFVPASLLFVFFSLLLWTLWMHSPLGLRHYAVGRNKQKAYVSGIAVGTTQFLTFVGAGTFAGIAAVALLGTTGAGDPTIGATFTLYSIAAGVVGGVSLLGGYGDAWGGVLGALFLGLSFTLVFAIQIDSYFQDLASGLIVLLGIAGASYLKRRNLKSIGVVSFRQSDGLEDAVDDTAAPEKGRNR